MPGLNHFGLLRKSMSTAKLANISGMSQDDIRHCSTTGELLAKDKRKFKALWKVHQHNLMMGKFYFRGAI